MKKIILLFVISLALVSCKKDPAIPPPVTGNTLPFENTTLKLDLVNSSLPLSVREIYFINKSNGIITTYDNKIFITADEGANWTLQYSFPDPPANRSNGQLTQILFTSTKIGYVVGDFYPCTGDIPCGTRSGIVLKTSDGGATWTKVFSNPQSFSAIAVNGSGDLYALAKGVLKSADGGLNWTSIDSTVIARTGLIFNNGYGFCNGYLDKIYRSADNGASWILLSSPTSNYLGDLKFFEEYGFCIGDYSQSVYKTTDHGNTWEKSHESNFRYSVVNLLSNENCLLFGDGSYSGGDFGIYHGAVCQTTNSGDSWTETEFVDLQSIRCSSFYSASEGYCVANRKLIKVTVK